jgi:hypothetical protein
MCTSWPWVSFLTLSVVTHTDRVLALRRNPVLNPKMKMNYFLKHWPDSLTSEVEDIVQKCVSYSLVYHLRN